MGSIVLFEDKKDCCGCGACVNACPKNAVYMKKDEFGFVYPEIDADLCVECGACKKACGYNNLPTMNMPTVVYAAAAKDEELLKKSASGGVFAVLAKYFLENNGAVYGAALMFENDKLNPKHIRIESIEELIRLQGSKYVQSDTGLTFQNVKQDLSDGKIVLYSGTPCQIAGLKRYIKKDYENLYTSEIICHGVPNAELFHNYIEFTEKSKHTDKTIDFYFRDKSKGQGMTSKFLYKNGKSKTVNGNLTSYASLFCKSLTYRSSCYSCRFACSERVADITMGDFWGFHEEYPNLDKSISLSNGKGISCVLINNEHGEKLFKCCTDEFIRIESNLETVARHNDQLKNPSKYSPKREKILELYKENGYDGVEKYYIDNFRSDRILHRFSGLMPKDIKRFLKKTSGRIKKR